MASGGNMGIAILLAVGAATLSQAPDEATIKTRIVGHPEAPAVLVGYPCAAEPASQIAPTRKTPSDTTALLFGPIKSRPFTCSLNCELGIKIEGARQPTAFRIGRIRLEANGRSAGFVSPLSPVSAASTCNGLPLIRNVHPTTATGADGFLVYVAEIHFSNGTSWRVPDNERFHGDVTSAWWELFRRGRLH
jgi:hypothetical protein